MIAVGAEKLSNGSRGLASTENEPSRFRPIEAAEGLWKKTLSSSGFSTAYMINTYTKRNHTAVSNC